MDLKIEDTGGGVWDLVLDPDTGDAVVTEEGSVEDVAQECVYDLLTWEGESLYEPAAGQPHMAILGSTEPVEGIAGLYALPILKNPKVHELEDISFAKPTAPANILTITYKIRVGKESATFSVGVPAP